jgi:Na+-driven multidrug efflux pump
VFILPKFWQLDGVWLAFPITDALSAVLCLILLIPQIRMFRRNEMRQVLMGIPPARESFEAKP